jgi:hypothetical protein
VTPEEAHWRPLPQANTLATMILLAKSETRTIQGQHALVTAVRQPTRPCQNDFASSITFGKAVAKVFVFQTVMDRGLFLGIAPINALKPRRSLKYRHQK